MNHLTDSSARGNYIAGHYELPTDLQGEWVSRSPGNLADELGKIQYSYSAIDQSVNAAREALPTWRSRSLTDRIELVQKCRAYLAIQGRLLPTLMARETGKPIWEGEAELNELLTRMDRSIADAIRLSKEIRSELPIGSDRAFVSRERSLGVALIIGSFDSPTVAAGVFLTEALLSGNTVIFKPSEKAAFTGQWLAEGFAVTGFPPGVFNFIQGEREVGRRLCVHEGVDVILFSGSYETGAPDSAGHFISALENHCSIHGRKKRGTGLGKR